MHASARSPGFTFCLVVTVTAEHFGTFVAVLVGFTACSVICGLTWRSARRLSCSVRPAYAPG